MSKEVGDTPMMLLACGVARRRLRLAIFKAKSNSLSIPDPRRQKVDVATWTQEFWSQIALRHS